MLTLLLGMLGCRPEADPCQGQPYDVRFEDRDGDGQGNRDRPSITCPALQPANVVFDDSDCDDTNPAIKLYQPESCDGLDNNCDGLIDNGLPESPFYLDLDGDGWGAPGATWACEPPPFMVERQGDCDDGDPEIHPDALEVCDGRDNDCDGRWDGDDDNFDPASAQVFHPDADGDGYGDGSIELLGCVLPFGAVTNGDDCDDTEALVNPGAFEVCNDVDDDCDGRIDDSDPGLITTTQRAWYLDADGDGLGDANDVLYTCTQPWFRVLEPGDCDDDDPWVLGAMDTWWHQDLDGDGWGAGEKVGPTCTPPGTDWVAWGPPEDCDDTRANVFPGRIEVCDGRDNDCDELIDDADPDIDPQTTPSYSLDRDGDGYGGPTFLSCTVPGPNASQLGDCNDGDETIHPDAIEICNGDDDDCNGFVDDDDPFLDPTEGTPFYRDADGDGHGDPFSSALYCAQPPGRVPLASDCDDRNPQLGPPTMWWPDQDGDNYGAGVAFGPSCAPPQPGWALVDRGEDCNDGINTVFPGATDTCGDGVDQDCDGLDTVCPRATCLEILEDGLSLGDGVYTLQPTGGPLFDVYCDMTTDGGGWTLVSASNSPVDDGADAYSTTLATLSPEQAMNGIWDGLRDVLPVDTDIRFTCKEYLDDASMHVDLVFYDIHWYQELTQGSDADVCFNEDDGAGYDPPPRRLNVLTGQIREAGNDWGWGYLEGEDTCLSDDDFTIDFDDRGMDSNQNDGTDWGEDDDRPKCGGNFRGEAWFIFVR